MSGWVLPTDSHKPPEGAQMRPTTKLNCGTPSGSISLAAALDALHAEPAIPVSKQQNLMQADAKAAGLGAPTSKQFALTQPDFWQGERLEREGKEPDQ